MEFVRVSLAVRRRVGAVVALVALAACAPAVAEPGNGRGADADVTTAAPGDAATHAVPAARAAGKPPAARSSRRTVAPDFGGLATAAVARLAHDAGVAVQVMTFEADATVTAQDPPPGTPLAAGGAVVLWLGTPPRPVSPPPPAAAPVTPPPAAAPTASPSPEPTVAAADETAARVPPRTVTSDESPATENPPIRTAAPGPSIRNREPAPIGLVLTGRASWYGEELAGSPVACGGRFDPTAATLASRELRCGTRVRITGPTGATAEAVVTDWGPAEWTGKRFDLSRAVFETLAPASRGWLDVEVEVIGS